MVDILVPNVHLGLLKRQLQTVMNCCNTLSDTRAKEDLMGVEQLLSEMIRIGEVK